MINALVVHGTEPMSLKNINRVKEEVKPRKILHLLKTQFHLKIPDVLQMVYLGQLADFSSVRPPAQIT
jgi:hypothetical protein